MPRRVVIIILAALIMGGVVAGGLYWRWLNSPRYALQQMALALKSQNMDVFFNHLDLKEIFSNSLEGLEQDLGSLEKPDEGVDEWTRLSRQMGRKLASKFLPKLLETMDKQIREGIEAYLRTLDNSQILGLATAVTLAKITVKGDEAQVMVKAPKTWDSLRFTMRRGAGDGVWRVVAVSYEDLKKIIKQELQG